MISNKKELYTVFALLVMVFGMAVALFAVPAWAQAEDLEITKNDSADEVEVGENLTYTLTVENFGNNDVADVTIEDKLPSGVEFVSDNGDCREDGRTITCDLRSVEPDTPEAVEIVVRPRQTGRITNEASVLAKDKEEDTDTETTRVTERNNNGNNDSDGDGIADSADTVDNTGEATASTDQEGTTSSVEQTVATSTADQYADTGEGTTGTSGTGASASSGPEGASAQAGGAGAQSGGRSTADPDNQAPVNRQQAEEQYGGEVVDEVQTTGPLPDTGGASIVAGTSLALVLFGALLLALRLVAGWRERS